uniref:Uncharacterized protein n=1 Tax=Rheinheimera sp. BAL341 TaxID=1708203 RepID=A0A486XT34_9GAMM
MKFHQFIIVIVSAGFWAYAEAGTDLLLLFNQFQPKNYPNRGQCKPLNNKSAGKP